MRYNLDDEIGVVSTFPFLLEGGGDGFVVGENIKIVSFYHVSKMFDSKIDSKEFTIVESIFGFGY